MDLKKKISRRQFIGQANCAAVGTASLLSSLLSLRLTAGAASASNFTVSQNAKKLNLSKSIVGCDMDLQ